MNAATGNETAISVRCNKAEMTSRTMEVPRGGGDRAFLCVYVVVGGTEICFQDVSVEQATQLTALFAQSINEAKKVHETNVKRGTEGPDA